MALVGSILLSACGSGGGDSPPTGAYADPNNWLCLPGRDDACMRDQRASVIAPDGTSTTRLLHQAQSPAIDCFYVYPTVSLAPTLNSPLEATEAERQTAASQFARFGSVCRMFAPVYRQVTRAGLQALFAGAPAQPDFELAYQDVLQAWQHYLNFYNNGRGVVLIGHSQGAYMLTRLIRNEIEGRPIQNNIVSALLIGWNVLVPVGQNVGGTFTHMPLCTSPGQTGCVVSYVSFRDQVQPIPQATFGRSRTPGQEVACTNPAILANRGYDLGAVLPTGTPPHTWITGAAQQPNTPFVAVPSMAQGTCVRDGTAHFLSVNWTTQPNDQRTPVIPPPLYVIPGIPEVSWGLHLIDINIAHDSLVDLVRLQSQTFIRP